MALSPRKTFTLLTINCLYRSSGRDATSWAPPWLQYRRWTGPVLHRSWQVISVTVSSEVVGSQCSVPPTPVLWSFCSFCFFCNFQNLKGHNVDAPLGAEHSTIAFRVPSWTQLALTEDDLVFPICSAWNHHMESFWTSESPVTIPWTTYRVCNGV